MQYNMHEPWKLYAESNKPDTKRQRVNDSTYMSHLGEANS